MHWGLSLLVLQKKNLERLYDVICENTGFYGHYFVFLIWHARCAEGFESTTVPWFPLSSFALRDNGFV